MGKDIVRIKRSDLEIEEKDKDKRKALLEEVRRKKQEEERLRSLDQQAKKIAQQARQEPVKPEPVKAAEEVKQAERLAALQEARKRAEQQEKEKKPKEEPMPKPISQPIIQPVEKRLIFSNAGMPYPIVKRGSEVWELEMAGMPLGLIEKAEYEDLTIDLEAGDFAIFCSDGVIEAENEAEEIYGAERLEGCVTGIDSAMGAEEVIEAILKDVSDFAGSAQQYDDMTIFVVKRL